MRWIALLIVLFCLAACSGRRNVMPLGQATFEAYRSETAAWVAENREFQTEDRVAELLWNTPGEWRPEGSSPEKGILLVHGLGDSPWSFTDIAPFFAKRGFLVRALLLPGCGTKPSDMIGVSADDWRRVVAEQAAILQREVSQVYLGGFSTGGNLVLEYAHAHPEIRGVALFSPGLKSDEPLDFLAPLASLFSDWLMDPDGATPAQDAMRYAIVPADAFAQFYYTSSSARGLLKKTPFDRPAVVVLAERDSVLDVEYILKHFDAFFTHPASRLIWYGLPRTGRSQRAIFLPDALPEWRISSFSHMGALFSPANEAYGPNGARRICHNGQSEANYARCLSGEEVWYSAYGHEEEGKIHARLTFNPYFDWQMEAVLSALTADMD
ncbi:MAG: alpha/beta fold hydrolase [Deltaproteobacteria bacterium]|jgi:esterase/lipase|nr:alpha/beta fold hydrolase [Deltaproteobacteria bacterium]